MIYINRDGFLPDPAWLAAADAVTNQLLAARTTFDRNALIDANENLWTQLKDFLLRISGADKLNHPMLSSIEKGLLQFVFFYRACRTKSADLAQVRSVEGRPSIDPKIKADQVPRLRVNPILAFLYELRNLFKNLK